MKKLLLLVLATLVLAALVACGGETTTAETTTTAPDSGQQPDGSTTVAPPSSSTEDPNGGEFTGNQLFTTGINLMTGEDAYMAVEPFKMSERAVAFENWHEILGFNWSVVFAASETETGILNTLLEMNEETGLAPARDSFRWAVVIDDREIEIKRFYNTMKSEKSGDFVYIRMDLGADWTFEQGTKEYDVVLKIYDNSTNELAYWAWLTEEDFLGKYSFAPPAEVATVPGPNGTAGDDEFQLTKDMIVPIQGPVATAADEFYVNVFDGNAGTKLCTRDMTKDFVFGISDSAYNTGLTVTSISIVGANDDEKRPWRAPTKFELWGSETDDLEGEWEKVLTVDVRDTFEAINYGEFHYELDKPSNYQYYKLVIVDPQLDPDREHKGPIYQFSELLIFVDKATLIG